MPETQENPLLRFTVNNIPVTRSRYVDHLIRKLPSDLVVAPIPSNIKFEIMYAKSETILDHPTFSEDALRKKLHVLQHCTDVENLAKLLDISTTDVQFLYQGRRYPYLVYSLIQNLLVYETKYIALMEACLNDNLIINSSWFTPSVPIYGTMTLKAVLASLCKNSPMSQTAKFLGMPQQLVDMFLRDRVCNRIHIDTVESIMMRLYEAYGVHIKVDPKYVRSEEVYW